MTAGRKDIVRLFFAGGLLTAAIITAAAGSQSAPPNVDPSFFSGSLCRHSPRGS